MSEPSSFFMKVTITKEAKEKYLRYKLRDIQPYTDWLDWLSNKRYYGTITEEDLNPAYYGSGTIESYIDQWVGFPRTFGFNEYDEERQVWTVSLYEFSENFIEYINFVSVFRHLQNYIEESSSGFVLVHSYIWGDIEDDFLVQILPNKSVILDDIPKENMREAVLHFDKRKKLIASDI